MPKINLLSMDVANLIAAGEVVDRPASVLKELLENAIDAGATSITAEIKRGGIEFIRVSDNGCGIAPSDLPLAIKRHATSKISQASDLASILTLGFRGEALAAITAVSRVRIMSKEKNSQNGTLLACDYGEVSEVRETGCPDGTTVIVEELFSNLPARRKFLKKDATEAMAVAASVEKVALSRPDIAIKLIIDGNIKFATGGDGDLKNTIYAIFGRDFASKLIEVEARSGDIGIRGYIGRSDNIRANRNFQNFFINGRYIRSRTAQAAIEQAYTSFIAPEKFPCCVLTIEIDPSCVDANVHPAKLEVKFSDERAVFEAVYYAVRNALQSSTEKPELDLPQRKQTGFANAQNAFVDKNPRAEQLTFANRQTQNEANIPPRKSGEFFTHIDLRSKPSEEKEQVLYGLGTTPPSKRTELHSYDIAKDAPAGTDIQSVDILGKRPSAPAKAAGEQVMPASMTREPSEEQSTPIRDYSIIGVAFNCYIIVQIGEKLLLIDKHAAHERILFERLKSNLLSHGVTSQCLLVPIKVPLDKSELGAIAEYREQIISCGFDFGIDSDNGYATLTQIPREINMHAAQDTFLTMAQRLADGMGQASLTRELLFERALYQTACKAAMKAGREDTPENVKWIVEQVMSLPDITVCPHGRPIAIELTHSYLDRQFERER